MFGRIVMVALLALVGWAVFAHTSTGAGHPEHYVVKPADTLWSIAQRHYAGDPRDAVLRVQQANRLAGTTIVPGEVLLLP